MTTGIVITAAGRGERFIQAGGQGNKLNAGFADAAGERRSLFEHTLRQALASGLPIQVVTRPDNLPVLAACAANQVPVTLLASSGLGDSIAAGVAATPHWQGWLIHLADMPFVGAEVFRQVADALRQHAIVRPSYAQQPGHPVGFSALLRKPFANCAAIMAHVNCCKARQCTCCRLSTPASCRILIFHRNSRPASKFTYATS